MADGVRYPFFFMGLLSLLLGLMFIVWFLVFKPDGAVSGGIEFAMAVVMIAFGSYVIWRRVTGKDAQP
jgi:multisubunit Na+/H+ antiporter MnhB subunit